MLWRLQLFFCLALMLASCSSPGPQPAQGGEDRLFVYRPAPPSLLVLSENLSGIDSELRLALPTGCSLSGLYPSPGRDVLLAELGCPNGPLAAFLDLTTGELQPLIDHPGPDSHFLGWSSEGLFVYLRVGSMTEPRILRVDLRSLRPFQVSLDPYTYHVAAAPDGRHVIYSLTHGLGFGSELWMAGATGGSPRLLLSDPNSIIAFARPSPLGDGIAFIKIPDSQTPYTVGELWWVDNRGANGRKLADADAGHGYAATWSQDGSRIVFVLRSNLEESRADQSLDTLVSNLAVVDLTSGSITQLTYFDRGRAGSPVWSPDGNTLAFGYVLDGRMEVQIADPAGIKDPSVILESACCPVWMRK